MSTKRAYFVKEKDEDWGIPVVAPSINQAKMLAFKESELSSYYYIDLRCTLQPHANIDGLPIGVVHNYMDALRRDITHWMDAAPRDNPDTYIESHSGYAACSKCIERLYYMEDFKND